MHPGVSLIGYYSLAKKSSGQWITHVEESNVLVTVKGLLERKLESLNRFFDLIACVIQHVTICSL